MAEKEGFEPPIPLRVCRISSAVHSTTLPLLRNTGWRHGGAGCYIAAKFLPCKSLIAFHGAFCLDTPRAFAYSRCQCGMG